MEDMDQEEMNKWSNLSLQKKAMTRRYVYLCIKHLPTTEEQEEIKSLLKESVHWDDYDWANIPEVVLKQIVQDVNKHDWVGF